MAVTTIIRSKKVNEQKTDKNHSTTTDPLLGNFHFLNFGEERHSNMATMGSNFLPFVKRGHLRFSQDVKLLFRAQHALVGDGGEGAAPVDHLPGNGVGGAPALEVPNVGAEDGLALVLGVVERLGVVS